MTERSKRGDGALRVVHEAVEVDRDQIDGLQRAKIRRVAHPPAGKIPAAFRGRAGIAIESVADAVSYCFSNLVIRPVRFRSWTRQVVPVAVEHYALGHHHHA